MGRRQWGAERSTTALPAVPTPPSTLAMSLGGLAIVITVTAWLTYVVWIVVAEFVDHGLASMRFILEATSYVLVMTLLTFSALMYLIARQGAMVRARQHVRVPRAEIDAGFARSMPTLTTLVPSFREEPAVVRATLLSAALQEYPHLRIVLLLDDPPDPTDAESATALAQCRALPEQLTDWLAEPARRTTEALARHEAGVRPGETAGVAVLADLAAEFEWARDWLLAEDAQMPSDFHTDQFVSAEILQRLAADFATTATALRAAVAGGDQIAMPRVTQLYRSLAWTFRAELDCFERKQYASLSHEPNKAMNLNAYIGLMGRSFDLESSPAGTLLVPAHGPQPDLVTPDSDFVLTLDADSVLLPEYCLRLVHLMQGVGNEKVAVTQTPYSAFRGAPTRLERIAGATTDLQHQIHQGLTYYDATFWVGANAVIRKSALDEIVAVSTENGIEVRRYIQDRTVIEDTESTIDLIASGWRLVNYPERLSYSATPPDFGSLAVQRARWANGGLIILPKFLRYSRARRKSGNSIGWAEFFLRSNYMASIAWASLGLLFLLAFPYDSKLLSPIIVLAALPYFVAQAWDLKRMRYKRTDVFRIYGFNLILVAINIGGVIKSLQQAATNSKIPFARTPKVNDRTAAPALSILCAFAILAFSLLTLRRDVAAANTGNALFAAFNATLVGYAIVAFIGLRAAVVDVVLGMVRWIRVPVAAPVVASEGPLDPDWRSVLYYGAQDAHRPADQIRSRSSGVTPLPRQRHAPADDSMCGPVDSAVDGPVPDSAATPR